jgi:hypothetical protein
MQGMQPSEADNKVVFVALGSRGDVQPLAIIAHRLSQSHQGNISIAFVTHFELSDLVRQISPEVRM